MKDAAYSFYVHGILNDFNEKFPGLDEVKVEIKEEYIIDPNARKPAFYWFHLSEDKKKLRIEFTYHKFDGKKGSEAVKQSPEILLGELKILMNRATERYEEIVNPKSTSE